MQLWGEFIRDKSAWIILVEEIRKGDIIIIKMRQLRNCSITTLVLFWSVIESNLLLFTDSPSFTILTLTLFYTPHGKITMH